MIKAKTHATSDINRRGLHDFNSNELRYRLFDEGPENVICYVRPESGMRNGLYFMEAETPWSALRNDPVKGELRVYVWKAKGRNPFLCDTHQVGAIQDADLPPDIVAFMRLAYEHKKKHCVDLDKASIDAMGLQPVE